LIEQDRLETTSLNIFKLLQNQLHACKFVTSCGMYPRCLSQNVNHEAAILQLGAIWKCSKFWPKPRSCWIKSGPALTHAARPPSWVVRTASRLLRPSVCEQYLQSINLTEETNRLIIISQWKVWLN